MTHDRDVIEFLTADVAALRPLRPPSVRVAAWGALGLPFIVLAALAMGLRPDLAAKMADQRYVLEQGAGLLTALLAGYAALSIGIPGRSGRVALLPLAPLAVWLGSLGQGCLSAWLALGPDGLVLTPDWECLPAIAMIGIGPAIAMAVMLRRAAPLSPRLGLLLGALAAAALGDVGLRLSHPQDASLMVLVWQFGSVAILSAMCGCVGRQMLRWRHRKDAAKP